MAQTAKPITQQTTLAFIIGLLSGISCWLSLIYLPDSSYKLNLYPGIIFGLGLAVLGSAIFKIQSSKHTYNVVITISGSLIAWNLALKVGAGNTLTLITAGLTGGCLTGVTLTIVWKLFNQVWLPILWLTAAGGLASTLLMLFSFVLGPFSQRLWIIILLAGWQAIFMASTSLLIHFRKHKNKLLLTSAS